METFKGIAASPGFQLGEAICLHPVQTAVDTAPISEDKVTEETELFEKAMQSVKEKISSNIADSKSRGHAATAEILEAHLTILGDEEYANEIIELIRDEHKNAAHAVDTVTQMYFQQLSSLDDPILKERGVDIKDLGGQVLLAISGQDRPSIASMGEGRIVVAHEFTPSDLVECARGKVAAIVAETGTPTAHIAIMAKSLRITACLGVQEVLSAFQDGDRVIVDGETGIVIRNPDEATDREYREKREAHLRFLDELTNIKDLPSVTSDGSRKIQLAINLNSVEGCDEAAESGAEGVGLFRTELYFVECDAPPSEETQFQAYREVAQKFAPHGVVIRTLDVGGDKEISYIPIPPEMNPFLGLRGIRLCLDRKDLFKTQLRALLHASAYGNVHIMYPMISDLQDLEAANAVLDEAKEELEKEGIPFNSQVPVGVMIEVPSAALLADQLVRGVDFFSIGTNDLTQYTLAVDRNNDRIAARYNPMHPAVLRLIKHVAEVAHQHGKWVGICGELGGDKNATAVLIGLGIDELSMSAANILSIKHVIRNTLATDALAAAERAIQTAPHRVYPDKPDSSKPDSTAKSDTGKSDTGKPDAKPA
ncbi:MAG: phosphoenolpyruvate--protein phosphotransferase [Synergistaceae bacterium]|nr:phosphoenolpyruvate--protein phosphotransferase [Synergistaceae bacterium]